jgi:predicted enzyme related to lactoylglutathione lyase
LRGGRSERAWSRNAACAPAVPRVTTGGCPIPPCASPSSSSTCPRSSPALAFWREAFGFEVTQTFDEVDFLEKVLELPGQANGPNLMLVAYKDGRDVSVGHGHGAVGLQCSDIAASHDRALKAGAVKGTGVMTVTGGIQVAVLHSPQGHEIELVQLPG